MAVRCRSGCIGPRVRLPRRVLTIGEPVPCSRAIILGYGPWFCVGVRTSGVPYPYGPGLDGNDPLLLLLLYSFLLCVVSVLRSGMLGLVWGVVMICSPWFIDGVRVG